MGPGYLALCLLLAVGASHGVLGAQTRVEYSEAAERQFRAALTSYDAGTYRDAAARFDQLVREYPSSQRITAAFVMKGKALYHAGENLDAARTMKAFLTRFPASEYVPDAEHVIGLVYEKIERYEEATDMLLTALGDLRHEEPSKLGSAVVTSLDSTIDAHLRVSTLRQMLSRAAHPEVRAYLWLKVAEKEAADENSVGAGIALDSLTGRYRSVAYADRISALRGRVASQSSVKLGALLPLMRTSEPSAAKEVGNDVYDGVLFAVEQYEQTSGIRVNVTLETRDTEREPRLATKGAEELCDDKEVIGVIGPVFSTTVTSAAAVANAHKVPLVTPTANAVGLASSGKYVFLANPDYDARGRAMARYAVVSRGFRTLAVLAPIDSYGKFLAEAFVREATRLGARVVATEWYQRGSSDLKQPLAKIRRAGVEAGGDARISFGGRTGQQTLLKLVHLGVSIRRLDSLMSTGAAISAISLLGPRARFTLDSLGIPAMFDESRADSLEYPVDAIEALYVPINSAEEIGVVCSQIVYFNLQTQILGSGEWNNLAELNANRRYCSGVAFESDSDIDTTGGAYAAFVNGFVARFKKKPSRNTLYGYDTALLVLSLVKNGATTREALQRALADVKDFHTLHTKITLAGARGNSWLTIMKYEEDDLRKVEELDAGLPSGVRGNSEKQSP